MDRITLGNDEFEGQNNAYVLLDEDRDDLALLDTGLSMPSIREDLRTGLERRGYGFADVDEIVLTHHHIDHAGLAGEIQAESDATVYVHEADAPLVAGAQETIDTVERQRRKRLESWGVPADAIDQLETFFENSQYARGEPADVTPITDGDILEVGGWHLETIHTPGHAAGLCSFDVLERPDSAAVDEAFVGDTVLPTYTPNVGGADVRIDRPLATYLESLERLVDRGYDRFWPGHRDPIETPRERVKTIVDHHHERTDRVLAILREHGPCDPWTVSEHLFGDLSGVHVMHGPGEAFAHLDQLHQDGRLEREDGVYHLLADDRDGRAPSCRR
ncbi:MBL fold metallo-hydrolase [Salinadaptatus halalkaliphilus]|uniref:MBL fold metallo-hydrolase n=1 Tax=Salinadaptatus halalkaliphilus TaxID=2419781 RepID=A0A4V3VKR9_9EURY|nr:MBL fold metallo-hydrolase [Salinadaptatus halalkaliphilus]THE62807.1 MBL fold metallo-hydrolase [Salinadaptatus halalkaliphilus]